jgi:hypothetical protein
MHIVLYSIKIYQAHSLVWYNPNLSIVPSVSCVRDPRTKPCSLFKPSLYGVLFLVVLVCLLCMCCARCLLRVEDRAIVWKSWSLRVLKSKSGRARVAFRWKKASDPNHPSTYALIQEHCKLIGTWRTTQENSTTTRHMALSWPIN